MPDTLQAAREDGRREQDRVIQCAEPPCQYPATCRTMIGKCAAAHDINSLLNVRPPKE
jgi:hypothetical protein